MTGMTGGHSLMQLVNISAGVDFHLTVTKQKFSECLPMEKIKPRLLNSMPCLGPFFHPSNKYIIFTTNLHGFQNFELYIVDFDGKKRASKSHIQRGF